MLTEKATEASYYVMGSDMSTHLSVGIVLGAFFSECCLFVFSVCDGLGSVGKKGF